MQAVKYAIAIPQFYADGEFDPAAYRSYFARAEELGFDSAWAQENMLGAAPQLSPLESMAYAAACTQRMRLGCVVFVSTLHSPVHLAKSLASLDQLSRGRIEVGVGTGGTARPFDGEFWQLRDAPMEPKPFQKPFPPLWFGANGPVALRRAVRLGYGFFGAGSTPTAKFAGQVEIVREALAAAGRPASDFHIAKRVYIAIDQDAGRARRRMDEAMEHLYGRRSADIEAAAVAGTPADCAAALREVIAAGAELILFTAMFEQGEHAERLAAEVIPQLG
jgi:alkanesulfonate monooxygenase SsuD/methylene tetrahydromethanopterin reductase-like flavin-dependent oxidoreductase (luciferase family)